MQSATVIQQAQQLCVRGDINFDTVTAVKQLGAALIKTQPNPVVNFSEMARCDSTGIALMLAWVRVAKEMDRKIQFIHVPSSLRAIAAVCGVSDILELKESSLADLSPEETN